MIKDLTVRYLPKKLNKLIIKPAEFAFLVHPRGLYDVYRKFSFLKILPDWFVKFFVKHLWPVIVSPITGLKDKGGKDVLGYVIGVPMTAHQMMENRSLARKKIIGAAKLAEKVGARLIGLGALTSSLTKSGLDLKDKLNIGIVTGHTYTSIVVRGFVIKVAKELEIDLAKSLIAVVGAAGSIGSNTAKLLTEKGVKNLLLVDIPRKIEKVNQLAKELKQRKQNIFVEVSDKIPSIIKAEIIIAATNAPEAVIKSSYLKPGTVVIDDAQPSDIDEEILKQREDVLVIEGGVVNTPGIKTHFNFGLYNKNDNFSCLGEVLILSHINWAGDYGISKINKEEIDKIERISNLLNFNLGEFQNSHKLYEQKDLERIKEIRKKHAFGL